MDCRITPHFPRVIAESIARWTGPEARLIRESIAGGCRVAGAGTRLIRDSIAGVFAVMRNSMQAATNPTITRSGAGKLRMPASPEITSAGDPSP